MRFIFQIIMSVILLTGFNAYASSCGETKTAKPENTDSAKTAGSNLKNTINFLGLNKALKMPRYDEEDELNEVGVPVLIPEKLPSKKSFFETKQPENQDTLHEASEVLKKHGS